VKCLGNLFETFIIFTTKYNVISIACMSGACEESTIKLTNIYSHISQDKLSGSGGPESMA